MLLLLSQQWLTALNFKQEVRTVSLDTSQAFDTVWHPALLAKLSPCGTEGRLHFWMHHHLSPFLTSSTHTVVLPQMELYPSPLLMDAEIPQGSVFAQVLFIIYVNDLSDALQKHSLPFCRQLHIVSYSIPSL